MADERDDLLVMRDIVDGQLLSSDGRRLGRVSDVRAELGGDEGLRLRELVLGPAALSRRLSSRLGPVVDRLVHGRFERSVAIGEVEHFGPTLELRGEAADYDLASGDDWAAGILRWVPGSGPTSAAARHAKHPAPPPVGDVIWISDLIGAAAQTNAGRTLGHVAELVCSRRGYRVRSLLLDRLGWLDRLNVARFSKRLARERTADVPWRDVERFSDGRLWLKRDREPEAD